ncbi:hypothetical protein J3Q32_17020, partial [Bordetella holmesii]|nr:hypothetical protein [Bordetella holmesii]
MGRVGPGFDFDAFEQILAHGALFREGFERREQGPVLLALRLLALQQRGVVLPFLACGADDGAQMLHVAPVIALPQLRR